jgi:cytochrome c biogenesis protein CcdA/thiol-disulfide isomerase/thioredoxin
MFSTPFVLFGAGMLTILLPCILPLIPIVLGVSIADRNRWRPLVTAAGMVLSFVGFTFVLQVVLSQFVEVADYIRIASYYVLVLFGIAFFTTHRWFQVAIAVLGASFFWNKGVVAVVVAGGLGVLALELGGRVAAWIQNLGATVQTGARARFGNNGILTAFIIGLTLGMVWVPCAGPALGFVLSLVRDEPGPRALLYLLIYGLGAALPLLLVGYGGQAAVHSVRALSQYSGRIKQVAGLLLVLSGFSLQFNWLKQIEIYLVTNTSYGSFATDLEEKIFEKTASSERQSESSVSSEKQMDQETELSSSSRAVIESSSSSQPQAASSAAMSTSSVPTKTVSVAAPKKSTLPDLGPAPEFEGLGTWINSDPLVMKQLRGKVVLVDFWTYSCINCIRTLPYMKGYWSKYGSTSLTTGKDQQFVLVGVHAPEFAFEALESNVRDAVKRFGITYPVVQDNQFGTWSAFNNKYWPAKYLIDAKGRIRYTHFGEGAYEETDAAIASLLAELGASGKADVAITDTVRAQRTVSHETYLGSRSIEACANCSASKAENFVLPAALQLGEYALAGQWQLKEDERRVLESKTGTIAMQWQGSEINLVLGLEGKAAPVTADVFIDGSKVNTITIDAHTLYNLYTGTYGEHRLDLRFNGPGVAAYAFTFGS